MSDEKELFFDGGYDRLGRIWTYENSLCHGCGEIRKVIAIDASEGEYDPGKICLDCVKEMLS